MLMGETERYALEDVLKIATSYGKLLSERARFASESGPDRKVISAQRILSGLLPEYMRLPESVRVRLGLDTRELELSMKDAIEQYAGRGKFERETWQKLMHTAKKHDVHPPYLDYYKAMSEGDRRGANEVYRKVISSTREKFIRGSMTEEHATRYETFIFLTSMIPRACRIRFYGIAPEEDLIIGDEYAVYEAAYRSELIPKNESVDVLLRGAAALKFGQPFGEDSYDQVRRLLEAEPLKPLRRGEDGMLELHMNTTFIPGAFIYRTNFECGRKKFGAVFFSDPNPHFVEYLKEGVKALPGASE